MPGEQFDYLINIGAIIDADDFAAQFRTAMQLVTNETGTYFTAMEKRMADLQKNLTVKSIDMSPADVKATAARLGQKISKELVVDVHLTPAAGDLENLNKIINKSLDVLNGKGRNAGGIQALAGNLTTVTTQITNATTAMVAAEAALTSGSLSTYTASLERLPALYDAVIAKVKELSRVKLPAFSDNQIKALEKQAKIELARIEKEASVASQKIAANQRNAELRHEKFLVKQGVIQGGSQTSVSAPSSSGTKYAPAKVSLNPKQELALTPAILREVDAIAVARAKNDSEALKVATAAFRKAVIQAMNEGGVNAGFNKNATTQVMYKALAGELIGLLKGKALTGTPQGDEVLGAVKLYAKAFSESVGSSARGYSSGNIKGSIEHQGRLLRLTVEREVQQQVAAQMQALIRGAFKSSGGVAGGGGLATRGNFFTQQQTAYSRDPVGAKALGLYTQDLCQAINGLLNVFGGGRSTGSWAKLPSDPRVEVRDAYARTNIASPEKRPILYAGIDRIDRMLAALPTTRDRVVYRGVSHSDHLPPVGGVGVQHGFMSTTRSPTTATEFSVQDRYDAPPGGTARGAAVMRISIPRQMQELGAMKDVTFNPHASLADAEKEVLGMYGLPYRVTGAARVADLAPGDPRLKGIYHGSRRRSRRNFQPVPEFVYDAELLPYAPIDAGRDRRGLLSDLDQGLASRHYDGPLSDTRGGWGGAHRMSLLTNKETNRLPIKAQRWIEDRRLARHLERAERIGKDLSLEGNYGVKTHTNHNTSMRHAAEILGTPVPPIYDDPRGVGTQVGNLLGTNGFKPEGFTQTALRNLNKLDQAFFPMDRKDRFVFRGGRSVADEFPDIPFSDLRQGILPQPGEVRRFNAPLSFTSSLRSAVQGWTKGVPSKSYSPNSPVVYRMEVPEEFRSLGWAVDAEYREPRRFYSHDPSKRTWNDGLPYPSRMTSVGGEHEMLLRGGMPWELTRMYHSSELTRRQRRARGIERSREGVMFVEGRYLTSSPIGHGERARTAQEVAGGSIARYNDLIDGMGTGEKIPYSEYMDKVLQKQLSISGAKSVGAFFKKKWASGAKYYYNDLDTRKASLDDYLEEILTKSSGLTQLRGESSKLQGDPQRLASQRVEQARLAKEIAKARVNARHAFENVTLAGANISDPDSMAVIDRYEEWGKARGRSRLVRLNPDSTDLDYERTDKNQRAAAAQANLSRKMISRAGMQATFLEPPKLGAGAEAISNAMNQYLKIAFGALPRAIKRQEKLTGKYGYFGDAEGTSPRAKAKVIEAKARTAYLSREASQYSDLLENLVLPNSGKTLGDAFKEMRGTPREPLSTSTRNALPLMGMQGIGSILQLSQVYGDELKTLKKSVHELFAPIRTAIAPELGTKRKPVFPVQGEAILANRQGSPIGTDREGLASRGYAAGQALRVSSIMTQSLVVAGAMRGGVAGTGRVGSATRGGILGNFNWDAPPGKAYDNMTMLNPYALFPMRERFSDGWGTAGVANKAPWTNPAAIEQLLAYAGANGISEPINWTMSEDTGYGAVTQGNHRLWLAAKMGLSGIPTNARSIPGGTESNFPSLYNTIARGGAYMPGFGGGTGTYTTDTGLVLPEYFRPGYGPLPNQIKSGVKIGNEDQWRPLRAAMEQNGVWNKFFAGLESRRTISGPGPSLSSRAAKQPEGSGMTRRDFLKGVAGTAAAAKLAPLASLLGAGAVNPDVAFLQSLIARSQALESAGLGSSSSMLGRIFQGNIMKAIRPDSYYKQLSRKESGGPAYQELVKIFPSDAGSYPVSPAQLRRRDTASGVEPFFVRDLTRPVFHRGTEGFEEFTVKSRTADERLSGTEKVVIPALKGTPQMEALYTAVREAKTHTEKNQAIRKVTDLHTQSLERAYKVAIRDPGFKDMLAPHVEKIAQADFDRVSGTDESVLRREAQSVRMLREMASGRYSRRMQPEALDAVGRLQIPSLNPSSVAWHTSQGYGSGIYPYEIMNMLEGMAQGPGWRPPLGLPAVGQTYTPKSRTRGKRPGPQAGPFALGDNYYYDNAGEYSGLGLAFRMGARPMAEPVEPVTSTPQDMKAAYQAQRAAMRTPINQLSMPQLMTSLYQGSLGMFEGLDPRLMNASMLQILTAPGVRSTKTGELASLEQLYGEGLVPHLTLPGRGGMPGALANFGEGSGPINSARTHFHELTHAATNAFNPYRDVGTFGGVDPVKRVGVTGFSEMMADFNSYIMTENLLRQTGMDPEVARRQMFSTKGHVDPSYWVEMFGNADGQKWINGQLSESQRGRALGLGRKAYTDNYEILDNRMIKEFQMSLSQINWANLEHVSRFIRTLAMEAANPKLTMMSSKMGTRAVHGLQQVYAKGMPDDELRTMRLAGAKAAGQSYSQMGVLPLFNQMYAMQGIEAQEYLAGVGVRAGAPMIDYGTKGAEGVVPDTRFTNKVTPESPLLERIKHGPRFRQFERLKGYALIGTMMYGGMYKFMELARSVGEINNQMSELNRVLGVSQEELRATADAALDLSVEFGQPFENVFNITEEWAKGGARGPKLERLTRSTTEFITATDLTPQQAVESTNAILKQFGLKSTEQERVQDQIVAVAQGQRVGYEDLAKGLAQVGALAKNAGFSMEQLNAVIAATASTSGETGETVGSMFRTVISRLQDPQLKTTTAFSAIGMDLESYVGRLPDLLTDLSKQWDNLSSAEKQSIAIAMGEKRRAAMVMDLMTAYGDAEGVVKAYHAAMNADGATSKAAATRMESFNKQVARLGAAFKQVAYDMAGSGILTTIQGIVTGIAGFFQFLNRSFAGKFIAQLTLMTAGLALFKAEMSMWGMNTGLAQHNALYAQAGVKAPGVITRVGSWLAGTKPKAAVAAGAAARAPEAYQTMVAQGVNPNKVGYLIQEAYNKGNVEAYKALSVYAGGDVAARSLIAGGMKMNPAEAAEFVSQEGLLLGSTAVPITDQVGSAGRGTYNRPRTPTQTARASQAKGGWVQYSRSKSFDPTLLSATPTPAQSTPFVRLEDRVVVTPRNTAPGGMAPTNWLDQKRQAEAYRRELARQGRKAAARETAETGGSLATGSALAEGARRGLGRITDVIKGVFRKGAEEGTKKGMFDALINNQQTKTAVSKGVGTSFGGVMAALGTQIAAANVGGTIAGKLGGFKETVMTKGAGALSYVRGETVVGKGIGGLIGVALTKALLAAGIVAAIIGSIMAIVNVFKKRADEAIARQAEQQDMLDFYESNKSAYLAGTLTEEDRTKFQSSQTALAKAYPYAINEYQMGYIPGGFIDLDTTAIQKGVKESVSPIQKWWGNVNIPFLGERSGFHYSRAEGENFYLSEEEKQKAIARDERRKSITNQIAAASRITEAFSAYGADGMDPVFAGQFLGAQAKRYSEDVTKIPWSKDTRPRPFSVGWWTGGFKNEGSEFAGNSDILKAYDAMTYASTGVKKDPRKLMEDMDLTRNLNKEQLPAFLSAIDLGRQSSPEGTEAFMKRIENIVAMPVSREDRARAVGIELEKFKDFLKNSDKAADKAKAAADALQKLADSAKAASEVADAFSPLQQSMGFDSLNSAPMAVAGASLFNTAAGYQASVAQAQQATWFTDVLPNFEDQAKEFGKEASQIIHNLPLSKGMREKKLVELWNSKAPAYLSELGKAINDLVAPTVAAISGFRTSSEMAYQAQMYSGDPVGVMMYQTLGAQYANPGRARDNSESGILGTINTIQESVMPEEILGNWQALQVQIQDYLRIKQDIINANIERQQEEYELQQKEKALYATWYQGLLEYSSFLASVGTTNTMEQMQVLQALAQYAKTPSEQLSMDEQIMNLQQRMVQERVSGIEGFLSHYQAMGKITDPDTEIAVLNKALAAAKETGDYQTIWRIEEQIYAAQQKKNELLKKNLAQDIFKRAAGKAGPLSISYAEYNAALGDSKDEAQEGADDVAQIMTDLAKHMKTEFGGMTTEVTGNVDDLVKKAKAHADALRAEAKAEQDAADAIAKLAEQIPQLSSAIKTGLDSINTPVVNAMNSLNELAKSISSLADADTGLPSLSQMLKDLGDSVQVSLPVLREELMAGAPGSSYTDKGQNNWGDIMDLNARKDTVASYSKAMSNLPGGYWKNMAGAVAAGTIEANLVSWRTGTWDKNKGGSGSIPTTYGSGVAGSASTIKRDTRVGPLPVSGTVSSLYGPRKVSLPGASTNHRGIDIAAPKGTSIRAAASGKVTFAGWYGNGGKTVMVENDTKKWIYMHMSTIMAKKGDKVQKGDGIGKVGSTGNSTGPHLHFGYYQKGVSKPPYRYVQLPTRNRHIPVAHSGGIGGGGDDMLTLIEKGEAIFPKNTTPALMTLLQKLNNGEVTGGSVSVPIEINLSTADGNTVTFRETVVQERPGSRVRLDRRL